MNFDMEVKPTMITAVSRRLMKCHHVRERHLPQVIQPNQRLSQHSRKRLHFGIAEARETCMRLFWRNINFICITCKVGKKSDRRIILADNATPILLFSGNDVLKEWTGSLQEMPSAGSGFNLDCLENKIRGVNLTVWMRI